MSTPINQPPRAASAKHHSSGGVVYTVLRGRLKVLLIKNRFDGRWTIPKGYIDPGETSEAAAVREIGEETGVECRVVELIGRNRYQFRFRGKLIAKQVDVYLLELTGTAELDPAKFDPHEQMIADARWFDPAEAVNAINYKNLQPLVARAADRAKEIVDG